MKKKSPPKKAAKPKKKNKLAKRKKKNKPAKPKPPQATKIVATRLPEPISWAELLVVLDKLTPWLGEPLTLTEAIQPPLKAAIDALSRATVWLPKPDGYDHGWRARQPAHELLKLCVVLRCNLPRYQGPKFAGLSMPADLAAKWREYLRQLRLVYSETSQPGLAKQRYEFEQRWKKNNPNHPRAFYAKMIPDYVSAHPDDAFVDRKGFQNARHQCAKAANFVSTSKNSKRKT